MYCSRRCQLDAANKKAATVREAALIDGTGNRYLRLRFTILRRDEFTCQYCGRTPTDGAKLHIDHIQPESKGGDLSMDNLVTSCFECNEGKRDIVLTTREQIKLKERVNIS